MNILISILSYNACEDVLETYKCFKDQITSSNIEIIIVDNCSTLANREKLKEKLPQAKIIQLDKNLGYTGGNNVALNYANKHGFDFIIICNQDINVSKDFVEMIITAASQISNLGLMGVVEKDYYTEKVKSAGGINFNPFFGRLKWETVFPINTISRVNFVQGAIILFSKQALNVGLRFDENIFMYCDEIDLGHSLKKLGLTAYLHGGISVKHKPPRFLFSPLQSYFIHRNRFYVVKKHYTFPIHILFTTYYLFIEIPIKLIIRWAQGHKQFTKSIIIGIRDALTSKFNDGSLKEIISEK